MNYERRNEVCKEFFAECMDMGGTKGVEYTRDDDALSNFNGVAEDLGSLTPFQVIYVYAKKHWDAIRNFAKHGRVYSNEGIRGRLVDIAVYAALMACMLEEEDQPSQYDQWHSPGAKPNDLRKRLRGVGNQDLGHMLENEKAIEEVGKPK